MPIDRRGPLEAAMAYMRAGGLPLPSPGIIIEAPLIEAARAPGAEVLLDGQGGDEVLALAHARPRARGVRPPASPETNFDPVISRPLAREALRGMLPPAIVARRDKSDFAAFYLHLLAAEPTLGAIRELLDPRCAGVGAYVDLPRVHRELLDRPPSVGGRGWRRWAGHVWNITTGELWLRLGV